MFSRAVRAGMRLKLWKINPIDSLRRAISAFRSLKSMLLPLIQTSPDVGASRPPSMCRSVLLPLRPRSATNLPDDEVHIVRAVTLSLPCPGALSR